MATYDQVMPEVAPHVAGAPEPLLINAIRNSVIEFCERSWAYFGETTPRALVANQQDYTISADVPAGTAIAQIMYAYFNGLPISPITRDDAIKLDSNWRNRTSPQPKRYIATDSGTKVSLIPVPSANVPAVIVPPKLVSNGITFSVALKPSRASTSFPDHLFEKYLEEIGHGAIMRLLGTPHKTWSNANLALFHQAKFLDGCSNARVDSSKSWTRATLRSKVDGVANW